MPKGEKMKLFLFILLFWLKESRGRLAMNMIVNIINKYQIKEGMQHNVKQNLEGESKTNRRSKMKVERGE